MFIQISNKENLISLATEDWKPEMRYFDRSTVFFLLGAEPVPDPVAIESCSLKIVRIFNATLIINTNIICNYTMTVWILARKEIIFSMAAGLIRLHMPGVK